MAITCNFSAVITTAFIVFLPTSTISGHMPGLKNFDERLVDNFVRDSRSSYEVQGKTQWTEGQLVVEEGASIQHNTVGHEWSRCNVHFAQKPDRFEIQLVLDSERNVSIRGQQKKTDNRIATTFTIDRSKISAASDNPVSNAEIDEEMPDSLVIESRYGLIRIYSAERQFLTTYLDSEPAFASIKIRALDESVHLNKIELSFSDERNSDLDEEATSQLDQTKAQSTEMMNHFRRGEPAKAVEICEQIMEIRKKLLSEVHVEYMNALFNLAVFCKAAGDNDRAGQLSVLACELLKERLGRSHPRYADSLQRLAEFHQSAGEFEKAISLVEEASQIIKGVFGEQHPGFADALNRVALMYHNQGKHSKVEPLLLAVRQIRKEFPGPGNANYAFALKALVTHYLTVNDSKSAQPLAIEYSQIQRKLFDENHPEYANSLQLLGSVYSNQQDFAKAESCFRQALEIRESAFGPDSAPVASSLNGLATLCHRMGDYARAESSYIRARDIRAKVYGKLSKPYSTTLNNLAELYRDLQKYDRAEPLYVEALDIGTKVFGANHSSVAIRLNNLANLYRSTGEYGKAELKYLQAQGIWEKELGKQSLNYARCQNNLGVLYELMGEYETAETHFKDAAKTLRDVVGTENEFYASNLGNLAGLYEAKDNFQQAEELYQSSVNASIAAANRSLPAVSEAQAMRWVDRNRPRTGSLISVKRRLGNATGEDVYRIVWQTKSLATRLRAHNLISDLSSGNAKRIANELRETRGRLASLSASIPQGVQPKELHEELQKTNLRKEQLERELAEHNPLSAMAISVRDAKLDDLMERLPKDCAIVDFLMSKDWETYDKQIEFQTRDGEKQRRAVKEDRSTIVYDAFILRGGSEPKIHWIPLGPAEPINSAIAQWRRDLQQVAEIRGLGNESVGVGKNTTDQLLRKLIWGKFEPFLNECKTVVLIPDGDLYRLPWSALPGRRTNSFLIEDYAIATGGFGQQVFGLLNARPIANNGLLIAGSIEYGQITDKTNTLAPESDQSRKRYRDRTQWTELPGAAKEAILIKDVWGARDSTVLLQETDASESRIANQLAVSRFVHMATHGFFSAPQVRSIYQVDLRTQSFLNGKDSALPQSMIAARNPLLLTGLVVSGANLQVENAGQEPWSGDDGILTGEEIAGLDMRNTELVTLSACETGLGDVAAGEGVFGLQRAFHDAGARSVIASLWKVSDRATQILMVEFYKNLWNKKMAKAEALRQAQITMLNQYDHRSGKLRGLEEKSVEIQQDVSSKRPHPRYWAAFQLSGDWR